MGPYTEETPRLPDAAPTHTALQLTQTRSLFAGFIHPHMTNRFPVAVDLHQICEATPNFAFEEAYKNEHELAHGTVAECSGHGWRHSAWSARGQKLRL